MKGRRLFASNTKSCKIIGQIGLMIVKFKRNAECIGLDSFFGKGKKKSFSTVILYAEE